jgi:hypothetical protein
VLFDSAVYIVFLVIVAAAYWRLGLRAQNCLLLAASYFFYAWWDWRFLLLIAGSTTVDYWIARQIAGSLEPTLRRRLLIAGVALNLCFLGYFKYFHFFLDSLSAVAGPLGLGNIPHTVWTIVLPPAISFYTFQEVAYLVDVYRGELQPATSCVASTRSGSSMAGCSSSPAFSGSASLPTAAHSWPTRPLTDAWAATDGQRSSALTPLPSKSTAISADTATWLAAAHNCWAFTSW